MPVIVKKCFLFHYNPSLNSDKVFNLFLIDNQNGTYSAFSSGKTDGGETARTISYLLNWMQDNKEVLVFATANDVRDLESEQFRIGRFSYIHFVDLPTKEDRQEIFRVHLQKRTLKAEDFDLDVLAEKAEQFSGAEIEGAVKDAVLEAFIDGNRAAQTKDVLGAIGTITPTAEMMKTKIDEIRDWRKTTSRAAAQPQQLIKRHRQAAHEFWKSNPLRF